MNLCTEEKEPMRTLATFLADLRFEKLPRPVIERTKELFLDWIASALAGRDARPVKILERLAAHMLEGCRRVPGSLCPCGFAAYRPSSAGSRRTPRQGTAVHKKSTNPPAPEPFVDAALRLIWALRPRAPAGR